MVSHDDVRKIAALAKLYIAEDQLDKITDELNGVISFADTISAVDASGYDTDSAVGAGYPLRTDALLPSYEPDLILSNAMESGDGLFIVRERRS